MNLRELPALSLDTFRGRLRAASPVSLESAAEEKLFAHYDELRRWNRRLSLIGPGTLDEVFARHYGESLAALPLLADHTGTVVDIGSGAGFPGLVLAAALPSAKVTLVDAQERKWAFLEAVARRAALPCRCLNARVRRPLPEGFPPQIDALTARAIRLEDESFADLLGRMGERAVVLLWVGKEDPSLLPGWEIRRQVQLQGSARRRIVEVVRHPALTS